MVEGRSKQAFKTWLAERPEAWREAIEVVAMDGFTGFKTATAEEMPDAVAVMDPFHVVRLASDALDGVGAASNRTSTDTVATKETPLLRATHPAHRRRPPHREQKDRLDALFAAEEHVEVEATWGVYQRMIAAYRDPDRAKGRELMVKLIDGQPRRAQPPQRDCQLGRTLEKRAADVLAYFDRPGTSNGPTEAINGRLEHLRGSALGFRNLTNYIARSLLEQAASDPNYTLDCEEPFSDLGSCSDPYSTPA